MKILITGGSGLLGQYLNKTLSKENDILTLYNNNPGNCLNYNSWKIDILDFAGMSEIINSFKPEIIIHTACFSNPEKCDAADRDLVWKTNVEAVKFITKQCEKLNCRLIYTSTDLVYDGNQGQMLKEDSILNPITLYAETKLQAEKDIANIFDNYVILRTALLFGFGLNHSRNNFHIMYDNFKSGKTTRLFYDQFRTPLSLINATEIISEICKSDINNIIFNFGGKERVSRVELGEILCNICNFDKGLIEKISMNDINGFPKVPDVSLNTDLIKSYGFKINSIEEAIREMILNAK